jgi:GT2 family glycosyltransferase/spore maturation protein CgeB
MLRVANFESERLGLPLIAFNDKNDAASVHVAPRYRSGRSRLLDLTADNPKHYFRLLWELHGARGFLESFDGLGPAEISLHFPRWEQHGAIAWIALLQGPNEETLRFFKKIPQSRIATTETGARVLLDCPRLETGNRLFLAFHFEATSCKATFGIPFLTWRKRAEPNVGVLTAHIADYTLTVSGWARDGRFPGLPVRVGLWIGNRRLAGALAASPATAADPEYPLPPGAMLFSAKLPVRERDLQGTAAIRIDDSGETHAFLLAELGPEVSDEIAEEAHSPSPEGTIIGKVETVSRTVISGWALCKEDVQASVGLVLSVGDQIFAYAECDTVRPDVQAIYQGHGFYGFSFELPPGLSRRQKISCTISPIAGVSAIKHSSFFLDPVGKLFEPSTAEVDRSFQPAPGLAPTVAPVSVIVLNRNGAPILDDLLCSAAAVEDVSLIEWIIVDHQSSDESEAVCRAASRRGQSVRFEKREGNFSFSESNNYGVQFASSDTLIFLNNDIVLRGPFVARVRLYLADERIGAVGINLLDYIPDEVPGMALPNQHLGAYFSSTCSGGWIRPFEARLSDETREHPGKPVEVPMVTGAFLAMRKADFLAVGGFDTEYYYGLEDLDLCLKIRTLLSKGVVCANDISAVHHRGFSRNHDNTAAIRWNRNNNRFNKSWASSVRRRVKRDLLSRPSFWTGVRPVIGFTIADAGDQTSEEDYQMACGLGRAIQTFLPAHLRYLTEPEWYDLSGIDILVVLAGAFNLSKVKAASPFLVTANWTTEWFDRWAEDLSMHAYDHVFASSQRAADYLGERIHRPVSVLPAASNSASLAAGTRQAEFACDYCFIGNRSDIPREIEFELDPARIDGVGAVFGRNWQGTDLEAIARAAVPASRLPDLYASTRIVVDDADIATAPWGSCKGRVFDALAAGCLLITNGALGAQELFGDLVPTFHDRESLTSTLNHWLTHEDKRVERVKLLQELVRKVHTYDRRARQFVEQIANADAPVKIAIKCAAVHAERDQWGDYHFAESLAAALRAEGHLVRVDCRESWNSGLSNSDDVVLVLRGLVPYRPKAHQKNIMWLISHPSGIAASELDGYDHLYVASAMHAEMLAAESEVPVEFLPQCTDVRRFGFDPEVIGTRSERAVFVGNSRGVLRDCVRWCIEQKLGVDIYGTGWEPFIKDGRLMGHLIPNQVLAGVYASSRVVLCDHWPDMKRLGYISNRVFDVLCAGGVLAVDDVRGLDDLIPGGYHVYSDAADLRRIVEADPEVDLESRKRVSMEIEKQHSFEARARTISGLVERLLFDRLPRDRD